MAPLGSPSMGLGEYLTLYAILGVAIIAFVGYILGTGAGGAFVFFLAGAVVLIITYAILSRVWRFLLHGSISAGSDGDKGGDL